MELLLGGASLLGKLDGEIGNLLDLGDKFGILAKDHRGSPG